MNKAALLIWQEHPDKVKYYLIETPTLDEMSVLKTASNLFINSSDTNNFQGEALMKINDAVSEKADYCVGVDTTWHCAWHECKVDMPLSFAGELQIFTAGIML